jgi:signal transduction histidine kinase
MNDAKTILIVDDEPVNRIYVQAILGKRGYKVLEASSGNEALTLAESSVDLILLDIMMPEMDGFQTCLKLKEQPQTREIPIIFLSALQDGDTRTTGFKAGGVDFVSKPFHTQEFIARINTHLTLQAQRKELSSYAGRLEVMVEERTRQLIHADRLVTLGTLSAALAHEVNNPVQFIIGNAELLKAGIEQSRSAVPYPEELISRMDKWNAKTDAILHGADRITELVRRLKAYGRSGGKEGHTPYDISDALQDALALLKHRIVSLSVSVAIPPRVIVVGDRQALGQVFVNLIGNALDALRGKGAIEVVAECRRDVVEISVKDNGPGIPGDSIEHIFDPFFTTKRDQDGTGLGLFIVRDILASQGGSIVCSSVPGEGTVFTMTLPLTRDLE